MKYRLIPRTNVAFEREIHFLESQYHQGWKLKKKGRLFYTFESVAPQEVTFAIDLLLNTSQEKSIEGLELVMKEQTSSFQKFYYVSPCTNHRFLIDEELQLDFYEKRAWYWLFIHKGSFCLPLLMLLLRGHGVKSPFQLILILIGSSIFSGMRFVTYKRAAEQVKERLEKKPWKGVNYIVILKKLSLEQLEAVEAQLPTFGRVKRVKKGLYRLRSTVGQETLIYEVIQGSRIDKENINIIHPLDLYFIHF